jgi:hypothetical protein
LLTADAKLTIDDLAELHEEHKELVKERAERGKEGEGDYDD